MEYVVYTEMAHTSVKYLCGSEEEARGLCRYFNEDVFPGALVRDRFYFNELIPLGTLLDRLGLKSIPGMAE